MRLSRWRTAKYTLFPHSIYGACHWCSRRWSCWASAGSGGTPLAACYCVCRKVDERCETDGTHYYRVTSSLAGIDEVYGYERHVSDETVRDEWLADVARKWGSGMRDSFADTIQIETLCQIRTQESAHEALMLPPVVAEETDEVVREARARLSMPREDMGPPE